MSREETTVKGRAGQSPLDGRRLAELRRRLEAERERLLGSDRETRERELEIPTGEPEDLADRAEEGRDREEIYAERQRLRARRLAVEEALARFTDGTYGLCLQCGEPIGLGRLVAVPAARYCIEHQEDTESFGLGD
jgi:DnaK suppressor protein